jgi:hypothetical protein
MRVSEKERLLISALLAYPSALRHLANASRTNEPLTIE